MHLIVMIVRIVYRNSMKVLLFKSLLFQASPPSASSKFASAIVLYVVSLLLLSTPSMVLATLPDLVKPFEDNVDSVVTINVTKETGKDPNNGQDVNEAGGATLPKVEETSKLRDFFNKHFNGKRHREVATGAGVVIAENGYLLTASHLVKNARKIWVLMDEGKEVKAKLVGMDEVSDIALLKIAKTGLKVPRIGQTAALKVGQWVLSIGTPFGFEKSASQGIVSALNRRLPNSGDVPFIQTDVAVNPGNSGGPLFNLDGELIAINTQIYSKYGGYQGVSFAVPVENALEVLETFLKSEESE